MVKRWDSTKSLYEYCTALLDRFDAGKVLTYEYNTIVRDKEDTGDEAWYVTNRYDPHCDDKTPNHSRYRY